MVPVAAKAGVLTDRAAALIADGWTTAEAVVPEPPELGLSRLVLVVVWFVTGGAAGSVALDRGALVVLWELLSLALGMGGGCCWGMIGCGKACGVVAVCACCVGVSETLFTDGTDLILGLALLN